MADELAACQDADGRRVEIRGPDPILAAALAVARSERLDGAILDVNLRGSDVYPVAEVLDARGVPLVFTTGYRAVALSEPYRDRPKITKPCSLDVLVASVVRAFSPAAGLAAAEEPIRPERGRLRATHGVRGGPAAISP